jgi:hypothetical protein
MVISMVFPADLACLLLLLCPRRQSAREAKEGFCPSSDLAEQPLSVDNFVYDVTRPRLVDLLTEEELEHYSSMRYA